jgi:hypothetical protein
MSENKDLIKGITPQPEQIRGVTPQHQGNIQGGVQPQHTPTTGQGVNHAQDKAHVLQCIIFSGLSSNTSVLLSEIQKF